jgi:hypothetical protein
MARKDFVWKESELGWEVKRVNGRKPLMYLVRDSVYPTMWRIKQLDNALSDMFSLTRAKDSAYCMLGSLLEEEKRVRKNTRTVK